MFVYINGQYVREEDVRISPFDHGFLYGLGLFETFRLYNGHPFLLDDHLERLNNGLDLLNIKAQYSREQILSVLNGLTERNDYTNARIRLNVSAGSGEIGLQTEPYHHPNLIVFSMSLPSTMGEMIEKKAVLLSIHRNTPEGDERLKSHHYLNNILAKREIGADLEKEGIFLTKEGYLAEGIISNLFWVKNDKIYTPSLNTGILNGITRQFIIDLAGNVGFEIHEGLFTTADAFEADEMFVTNSIQEIVPVSDFAGKPLAGRNGKATQELHKSYRMSCQKLWSRNELI